MITCPNCATPLSGDVNNPNRLYCMNCGYVLEGVAPAMAEPVGFSVAGSEVFGVDNTTVVPTAVPGQQDVYVTYTPAVEETVVPTAAPGEAVLAETVVEDAPSAAPSVQEVQPVTTQPGAVEAEASVATIEAAQPVETQPAVAQPVTAQPMEAQPVAAQPISAVPIQAVPDQEVVSAAPVVAPIGNPVSAENSVSYWGTQGYAQTTAPTVDAHGNPVGAYGAPSLPKGLAIAALVLGIIAILGCWIPFINIAFCVLGVVAIILGLVASSRAKRGLAAGRGLGITGAILGLVGVVLSLVVTVTGFFFVQNAMDDYFSDSHIPSPNITAPLDSEQNNGNSAQAPTNDGAWTSMNFTLGDSNFTLGRTTLSELEKASGWTFDMASAGYANGYIVQAGDDISSIMLTNKDFPDGYMEVDVYNNTNDQRDLKECVVEEITIQSTAGKSGGLNFSVGDGIGLGSTLEEAQQVLGEPTYTYDSTYDDYKTLTYVDSTYEKELYLAASDGKTINYIELALD